jgi:hypothetical protein
MKSIEMARTIAMANEYSSTQDGETSYVFLGHILPEEPSCNSTFLRENAGRYFLRWDFEQHKFVSNMKELYPED